MDSNVLAKRLIDKLTYVFKGPKEAWFYKWYDGVDDITPEFIILADQIINEEN